MTTVTSDEPGTFEAPPRWVLPDLAADLPGARVASSAPTEEVVSHFDTADLRLLRRGISLFHTSRSPAGADGWSLSLPSGGGQTRWPGERASLPEDARRLVRGVAGGAEVSEVARLVTTRHRHDVLDAAGAVAATVEDTLVDGSGPGGALRRWRRIEVRPGGGGDGHQAVARAIGRAGAFAVSSPASEGDGAGLGVARVLAGPGAVLVPRPAPEARPGAPVLTAAAAAVAAGVERLLAHDPAIRVDGRRRAVHQARVAARRLRSDLATFEDVLDPVWAEQARSNLRWLGKRLGAVRDLDVLAARLRSHAGRLAQADRAGVDVLVRRAEEERSAALAEALVALESPRYLELIAVLTEAALAPPRRDRPHPRAEPVLAALPARARREPRVEPGRRARKALPVLVRRPWKRLRRRLRALPARPSDSQLHQVRIASKRLRYAAEAAEPVCGRKAATLARRARRLQSVLGDHHDSVMAEAWLRSAGPGAEDPRAAFVAGLLAEAEGAERRDLEERWRRAAGKLAAAPVSWLG